jgi:hypothetical protein
MPGDGGGVVSSAGLSAAAARRATSRLTATAAAIATATTATGAADCVRVKRPRPVCQRLSTRRAALVGMCMAAATAAEVPWLRTMAHRAWESQVVRCGGSLLART